MVKELIKQFLLPSDLMALLLLAGLGCLVFRKARRFAARLFCAGGLLFLVFGNSPVSFHLIRNLEERNPAFSADLHVIGFKDIVVLTGHGVPDERVPISSTLNSSGAFRVLEALRLHELFPDAGIVISGHGDVPLLMERLLVSLGVREDLIVIENESRNTFESAVHLKERVRDDAFILITSAWHMPRSLGAFRRLGMNPIPAPTDYLAKMYPLYGSVLPNPNNLMRADLAVHEHLGILWYRLMGRL